MLILSFFLTVGKVFLTNLSLKILLNLMDEKDINYFSRLICLINSLSDAILAYAIRKSAGQ